MITNTDSSGANALPSVRVRLPLPSDTAIRAEISAGMTVSDGAAVVVAAAMSAAAVCCMPVSVSGSAGAVSPGSRLSCISVTAVTAAVSMTVVPVCTGPVLRSVVCVSTVSAGDVPMISVTCSEPECMVI